MYYFISYRLFDVLNTPFRYKQSSIAYFAIAAKDGIFWINIVTSSQLICDVMRTRGTGIVTSYSSIVLARANWRKGDLHQWITTVNINFSPPSIHGLACKKYLSPVMVLLLLNDYDWTKNKNEFNILHVAWTLILCCLNGSRLVLQLSLLIPMKSCVKLKMKMQLEHRR